MGQNVTSFDSAGVYEGRELVIAEIDRLKEKASQNVSNSVNLRICVYSKIPFTICYLNAN